MIISNEGSNYLIKIAKDYPMYEINKDELYYVSYKLIRKCSEETWKNLLDDNNKIFSLNTDDILENNEYIDEDEEKFIQKNKIEFDC